VFVRDPATGTWAHTTELTDPGSADWDMFGDSVGISGGTGWDVCTTEPVCAGCERVIL
jgi:hypothetical protein